MNQNDSWISNTIRSHGWAVTYVPRTGYSPAFCFTTGLKELNHPELIVFGLSQETLMTVLNIAGDEIMGGRRILTDQDYDLFFSKGHARFITVDPQNMRHYFGAGIAHYKTDAFAALQLVWQDRNEQYPWDSDYEEEFRFRQPLLDRDADFKFPEAENCGVFTSRQVLDEKRPVLQVYHDAEGDWQFLTGDEDAADIRIVGLKCMVEMDPGLNSLFDLDFGEWAEREGPGATWNRTAIQEEEESN